MNRRRHLSALAALAWALGCAGGATSGTPSPDSPAGRPDPNFLERRISEGQYLEAFVAQVMAQFREADADQNGLDAKDLERQWRQRTAQQRAQNLALVFRYDLNGDLVVTPEEVAAAAPERSAKARRAELERFDVDGDGAITLDEVVKASARISQVDNWRLADNLASMLSLPAAQDGRLTAAELEAAARAAFARADTNGDGRISREESQRLRATLPPEPPREQPYDVYCPMPAAGPKDLIVLFGAYEGRRSASAPTDSPRRIGSATVQIEPGSQPIYLILPSYQPIRWRIEGATNRVRQVVLSSSDGGETASGQGVDGVPPQRVRMFDADGCIRHFTALDNGGRANAAVALRLGRPADVVAGVATATAVSLPSAQIQPQAKAAP